jgi:hypothetical protein
MFRLRSKGLCDNYMLLALVSRVIRSTLRFSYLLALHIGQNACLRQPYKESSE